MDTPPQDHLPAAAQEVRGILSELGWTHHEAAEHIGVGRVSVSRWCSGARDPGEQVLRHLRMIRHLRRQLGNELWSETMAGIASVEAKHVGQ